MELIEKVKKEALKRYYEEKRKERIIKNENKSN